jgi:uncharacterized membrane protein
VSTARAGHTVDATPEQAFDLWVDVRRWQAFVDGFRSVEHVDEAWPAAGSSLVWHSVPNGRGRVEERVLACTPGELFETDVTEERLRGRQTAEFRAEGASTAVSLTLAYAVDGGPLTWLTDVLFIRRAQGEALERTLDRFAAEAAAL